MHLILILDGFGYDVVKKYREAGGFKGFHDPSAVVAPYPSMTDLCIEDLIGGEPCEGLEAKRYVMKENRVRGGNLAYLLGQNQPYRAKLDYRAASWLDALCYVAPWLAFKLELKNLKRGFLNSCHPRGGSARACPVRRHGGGDPPVDPPVQPGDDKYISFIGYLVTTAGIGTKYGAAGQNMCLGHIETLCAELLARNPKLRITLVSDHGHGYVTSRLYDINRELKKLGWRPTDSLQADKDVVHPAFGLVHCAGFHTRQPAELAADLAKLPCTEIVSYKDNDKVVILAKGEKGYVWPADNCHSRESGNPPVDSPVKPGDDKDNCRSFVYLNVNGDPLDLALPEGGEIEMTSAEWLDKSLVHHYPDAPSRLWRAHTDLVQNTPDVILAIKDGYFFGSKLLSLFAHVESTHGGLNRSNSLAFRLDTRRLPEYITTSREALAPAPSS